MSPESPHHMLRNSEAASCQCLSPPRQPAAAVALGLAEPAQALERSHSVLKQLQPFGQQGEKLQGFLSPTQHEYGRYRMLECSCQLGFFDPSKMQGATQDAVTSISGWAHRFIGSMYDLVCLCYSSHAAGLQEGSLST